MQTSLAWITPPDGDAEPIVVDAGSGLVDGPLVSCLMISHGALFPARHALDCFLSQTYPRRELVVVIDGQASEVAAYVAGLADPRIRVVAVQAGCHRLGELRNLALEAARGDHVCQWDEGDLHAPTRLEAQLAALLATRASACVLRRCTLWWPDAARLACSGVRQWEGSTLAARAALPPYPPIDRGADAEVLAAVQRVGAVVSLEAPELWIHVHHGEADAGRFSTLFNHARTRWSGAGYRTGLAGLEESFPIRQYLSGLPAAPASATSPDLADAPLVSIVVRSMGRPELRLALESLAAQDYPRLDVIVVDATGGNHPPLPELDWRPGHGLRMVGAGRRLPRPHAGNAGLAAVRGDWFGFLDDDDTCDPGHVADLVRAARDHPEALVVYGTARMLDAEGEVAKLFGIAFNRAIMFHSPLFYWQAALIRRSAIDLGCRFDERLDVCEDRDLLAQIAEFGRFAFVDAVSFNYRPDLGTSGTGTAGNRDILRLHRYDQLFLAKWQGNGTFHTHRSARLCQRAVQAYAGGDAAAARALFERVLADYPDDPNALHGLGFLSLQAGDPVTAEAHLRRAVEINTAAGEYRMNLAQALERTGRRALALAEAWAATSDVRVRGAAFDLHARLGGRVPASRGAASAARPTEPSRLGPCPCGSGKRYKHCCGQAVVAAPAASVAARVVAAFRAGDAEAALALLETQAPADVPDADAAAACADIARDMGRYELAYTFYRRAGEFGESERLARAVMLCGQSWYRDERNASMQRVARRQIERLDGGTAAVQGPLHVVSALGTLGGSEHQAIALHAWLSRRSPARLWSTVPPLPEYAARCPVETIDPANGRFPESGHLIFVGPFFAYGDWLDRCRPDRVTVCFNTDLLETLIARLVEFEEFPTRFRLDLTYPSDRFRRRHGLPGVVEYPLVDTERFSPSGARAGHRGPLMVGRHSRDHADKFHPNDPALFRALAGDGHRLKVTGGRCLVPMLGADAAERGITLLPEDQQGMVGFLDGLDAFLYRVNPAIYETCGTVVLEAMSMALPVVLFGDNVGAAELIEQGRNGYLVETEAEARARLRELAANPALRLELGAAARASVLAAMRRQDEAMQAFYFGAGRVPVAESGPGVVS